MADGPCGREAGDVSATDPAGSPERIGTLTYLHCPRCRLAMAQKHAWLAMAHCPRCLARARIAVELFSSPLPAATLYAENGSDGPPHD